MLCFVLLFEKDFDLLQSKSNFLVNFEMIGYVALTLFFLRHFRIRNFSKLFEIDFREEGVALVTLNLRPKLTNIFSMFSKS